MADSSPGCLVPAMLPRQGFQRAIGGQRGQAMARSIRIDQGKRLGAKIARHREGLWRARTPRNQNRNCHRMEDFHSRISPVFRYYVLKGCCGTPPIQI